LILKNILAAVAPLYSPGFLATANKVAGSAGSTEEQASDEKEETKLGNMTTFHDVKIVDLKFKQEGAVFELDFKQPNHSAAAAQQVKDHFEALQFA
jgi:hypothetical protein